MTCIWRGVSVLVAVFFLVACSDPAKLGLERCLALEAKGDLLAASNECGETFMKFPETKAGKEAKAKYDALVPAVEKIMAALGAKAEEENKKAEAARKAAAVERRKVLAEKVQRRYWADETDDVCTGKGYPPYRWTYAGATYAENAEMAEIDGCKPTYTTEGNDTYCCPLNAQGVMLEKVQAWGKK